MQITAALSKASRAMLGWKSLDLSERSGVPHDTIRTFESGRTKSMTTMNEKAILQTFEAGGLSFITENGGGAGVRLAKPAGE